jgi:hypothetical protein
VVDFRLPLKDGSVLIGANTIEQSTGRSMYLRMGWVTVPLDIAVNLFKVGAEVRHRPDGSTEAYINDQLTPEHARMVVKEVGIGGDDGANQGWLFNLLGVA